MTLLVLVLVLDSATTAPLGVSAVDVVETEELPASSKIWAGRALFKAFGYEELPCGDPLDLWPAECCACRAIIDHFEFSLDDQTRRLPSEVTHDIPASFRMGSDEKVPFSRHMHLILHTLPRACWNVSMAAPKQETRVQEMARVLEEACEDLYEQFEDEVTQAFYNNVTSQTEYICGDAVVAACSEFFYEEYYVDVPI